MPRVSGRSIGGGTGGSGSTGGKENAFGGNNVLLSGSKHNLRWEVSNVNSTPLAPRSLRTMRWIPAESPT